MHKFNQPTKLGNERERVNSFPKNFSFHFLKTTVILFCLGFLFFAENVGATTPDQISGLKLWLDASQGVTTDGTTPAVDGNTVQQWNDQSIGGYNAIQLTADSKPIYKTNVMNGKPVVRFGGGQKIITSNFLDSSFNTSLTFFIVTATDNRGIQISTSNQGTTWYTGNDSGAIFETDNLSKQQSMMKDVGGISLSNPTIETLVYNGSQKVMHLNGISNTLSATGNLGLSGALTIGTLSTVDMFSYTGDIAEIIVYNSVLTDTQVEQIESYLMSKYGITPPPSISTLPSLIFDGDSLTSGNGADGGYDYPSQVQRQYNGITTVKNFGVPSQTLQAMLTTALTRIDPEYQASRPENILTIWGGTNDLYFGSGNESDITNTYNNLVSYVNDRKTIGYKVIVNTILPRSGYATPDTYFEAHRQAYNTLIRNNWKTFADAIADVASDSRIGDFGDELDHTSYSTDKVHMSNTGYGIVANYAVAAIKQIINPIAISDTLASPSTTTANISWTTNQSGSTKVNYGLTNSYGSSTTETDTSIRVLNHSVTLSNLLSGHIYHYQTVSTDINGNQVLSGDRTFTTIDIIAPTTTVSAGIYTFGTWSENDVTVSLTCDDGVGSGCASTLYCIDNSNICTPTTPYTSSVVISNGPRTSYIRYYSIDVATNSESISSRLVMIAGPAGGGSFYIPTPSTEPVVITPTPEVIPPVVNLLTSQQQKEQLIAQIKEQIIALLTQVIQMLTAQLVQATR